MSTRAPVSSLRVDVRLGAGSCQLPTHRGVRTEVSHQQEASQSVAAASSSEQQQRRALTQFSSQALLAWLSADLRVQTMKRPLSPPLACASASQEEEDCLLAAWFQGPLSSPSACASSSLLEEGPVAPSSSGAAVPPVHAAARMHPTDVDSSVVDESVTPADDGVPGPLRGTIAPPQVVLAEDGAPWPLGATIAPLQVPRSLVVSFEEKYGRLFEEERGRW